MTDRVKKDFAARDLAERESLLANTWCGVCEQADLGMTDPVEFEDGENSLLEGRCAVCGAPVETLLTEVEVDE
jgi:hypothetical protein